MATSTPLDLKALVVAAHGDAEPLPEGFCLKGQVVGFKRSRTFTDQSGNAGEARPKVGIQTADGTIEVRVDSDGTAQAIASMYRDDTVIMAVTVRPPFNGRGALRVSLVGVGGADAGWE